MANVAHASLTGSELHEPKGADTAALGTVYVADGAGSGSWNSIGTSSFTGMIADFPGPLAPTGWLELDGSVISTSTYSALFAVMSMTTSGTRSNGNPVVTSIPSTANMQAGYYVFGTGINTGTTILTVDSPTQITLSAGAASSGTSSFFVSPYLMNTGTIKLPDTTTAGRFRRSRTSATKAGELQSSQNLSHTHAVTGNTAANNVDHTHTFSGTTGTESASHTHNETIPGNTGNTGGGGAFGNSPISGLTGVNNQSHTHSFSGTTGNMSTNHSHPISLTSAADGGSEARPNALVVLTCIKT